MTGLLLSDLPQCELPVTQRINFYVVALLSRGDAAVVRAGHRVVSSFCKGLKCSRDHNNQIGSDSNPVQKYGCLVWIDRGVKVTILDGFLSLKFTRAESL